MDKIEKKCCICEFFHAGCFPDGGCHRHSRQTATFPIENRNNICGDFKLSYDKERMGDTEMAKRYFLAEALLEYKNKFYSHKEKINMDRFKCLLEDIDDELELFKNAR